MTKSNNSLELIEQFLEDLNAIELASNGGASIVDALQAARDHAQRSKSEILDVKMESMACDDNSEEIAVSDNEDEEENNSKLNEVQLTEENKEDDPTNTESDEQTVQTKAVSEDNTVDSIADAEQKINDETAQDKTASTEAENWVFSNSPDEMSKTENKETTASFEVTSDSGLTQSTIFEVQAAGEDASQSTDAIQLI